MTILKTALALAITSLAIGALGCSSDKTGDGSTSSSSGTSGGTSTSSGGTSGSTTTSSSGTSSNCQKSSLCINGACTCQSGPKKDASCQKTDTAASDYCDTLCYFCQ